MVLKGEVFSELATGVGNTVYNILEHRFTVNRIFPCKHIIEDSVLTQANTSQRKPVS